MKGLLDTHALLWWDTSSSRLSPNALTFLRDPNNVILISVINAWEIAIKQKLGKLTLSVPLRTMIAQQQQRNSAHLLSVTLDHVLAIESLPPIHKDPFDRLLIAQANVEGAVLVSADPIFSQYPVRVLW